MIAAENFAYKVIITILAMLILSLAIISFRWALADMWYFSTSYQLDIWSKSQRVDSKQNYDQTLKAIEKAVFYNPDHPHYLHTKGKVIHWGIISQFEDKYTCQDIKQIYLTATALREPWPLVWSDLARVTYIIEGLSQDTQRYLNKALLYGPYKKEVIIQLLDIYLQSWNLLDKQQIQLFYNQIENLINKPHLLIMILKKAEKYGLSNVICVQFKLNQKFKNLPPFWKKYEYCK